MEGKSRQDPVVVSSTGLHNSVDSPPTSQIINKLPFTAMTSPTGSSLSGEARNATTAATSSADHSVDTHCAISQPLGALFQGRPLDYGARVIHQHV